MKRWRRWLASGIASVMVAATLAGCGNGSEDSSTSESGEKYQIGVVQIADHPALNNARDGFLDGLDDLGIAYEADQQNAQGETANLKSIGQNFVSKKVDLVLAIATNSATSVAAETDSIPILGTAITDFVDAGLVSSNEAPGGNVSGTSDMNPIGDQIDLILKLVPDAKTIGVIYASSEPNSAVQVAIAKEEMESRGLVMEEMTINTVNDIQQVATSLVSKVDAIFVPTDNVIASAIPNLISVTEPAGVVVVGGEAGQVEQGATATIGIDYYKLGRQTAEQAKRILVDGEDVGTLPVETAKEYDFVYNESNVTALGITMPEDLKATATQVFGGEGSSIADDSTTTAANTGSDESFEIGVIQLISHDSLDAARSGFVDKLASLGVTFEEEFQNAQGDKATLKTISQSMTSKKKDLILAIATDSATSIAAETSDIPIVGTAITDFVGSGLAESNEHPGANLTGSTDFNPDAVIRQIELIPRLVPEVKTVGLIYSSDEPNSLVQIERAKQELERLGLDYEEATISSVVDIPQVASSLVGKVEAIYVPTDNKMASAMSNLAQITDPAGIVTVPGAAGMVTDGGTATYGLDYYKLGEVAADMAYRILVEGADPATMPIESVKVEDFAFVYNQGSLDAIGMTLPEDLALEADR